MEELKRILQTEFNFSPNRNQLRDLYRLCFEIMRREQITLVEVVAQLQQKADIIEKYTGGSKFTVMKDILVQVRFPLTVQHQKVKHAQVFLGEVVDTLANNYAVSVPFQPQQIFIEESVAKSPLAQRIQDMFGHVQIEHVDRYSQYLKQHRYDVSQLKKPVVFVVRENSDFLKPCPCTKGHVRCGYWIFNLGFGCPFDCSYCFLQQYANFPGIVVPANIEDFFVQFDRFNQSLNRPIRIGTGEFCDSLALDYITQYSKQLVPYFADKKVLFELKTKSDVIDNLLAMPAPGNTVVSWSLNPASFAQEQELGAASIPQRLRAASAVQQHGYKIGFHFDPVIYGPSWEKEYKQLVDLLYQAVSPGVAWISIGTLRSHRSLKSVVEQRFPASNIFYGELLLGDDKKLRYPKFLREQMYKSMMRWIRAYDTTTPIYLCMEDVDMWQQVFGKQLTQTGPIESYIMGK